MKDQSIERLEEELEETQARLKEVANNARVVKSDTEAIIAVRSGPVQKNLR